MKKSEQARDLSGLYPQFLAQKYSYSSVTRETMLNFVFLNFYRPSTNEHADDHLGWHSDDDDEMVPGSSIVSLSVGDTRVFAFRKKGETKQHCAVTLAHGDDVIMRGTTQTHYQHAITTKGVKQSKKADKT